MPHRVSGNAEQITAAELIRIVDEYSELLEFIQAVESGLITITLSEYHMLPGTFLIYWRTYKDQVHEIREYQKQNRK